MLRAIGFTHLAVEGLNPADTGLPQRGYPIEASGYYVGEPLYGEIVREALRLGYTVVAYEPADAGQLTSQQRETAQAQALQRLLEVDPHARMLVHAGYAHADKFPGQLPLGTLPMAYELARLSGIEPLSIDQTILAHGDFLAPDSPYRRLLSTFPVEVPSVLVARTDGHPWSYRPQYNDATVLLPAAAGAPLLRPTWLGLQGRRRPVAIDASACKGVFPCLFAARRASEGDDAVPADQFVLFTAGDANWPLYLAPGLYRLEVRGDSGQVLATHRRVVEAAPGLRAGAAGATMALPLQTANRFAMPTEARK